MTRKWKLIKRLLILVLLILVIEAFIGASITPLSAHKRSERTANYGPSTIIKSQKVKGRVLYLCKYDKWFSLNTVKRDFLGLWYAGDQVHGMENDLSKQLNYSYTVSSLDDNYLLGRYYGIVNDPNISSVKFIIIIDGQQKTFEQNELYDNMFLFTWEGDAKDYKAVSITGLDKDSNIIYEEVLP